MGVIQKIIASIFKGAALTDMQDDDLLLGTRQKITPYGYKLLLINDRLQLLPANQPFNPPNSNLDLPSPPNSDLYWHSYLNVYGTIKPGISQIWIQHPNLENEIVGTIDYDPSDDRLLIYDIDPDTLPSNTLEPVNGIVNPLTTGPGAGLPAPVNGRRYLIVENMGGDSSTSAWGSIVANANDIIEYNSTAGEWEVSFDSVNSTDVEFVTNLVTNVQYKFDSQEWIKSYEGYIDQGDYSIVI
jgi:hypothetical protein